MLDLGQTLMFSETGHIAYHIKVYVCLFVLMLYIPVNNFSVIFCPTGLNQYEAADEMSCIYAIKCGLKSVR